MNNDIVISSANDIDLCRHGVIEAHAGTGKTYTIVNLVLRMLEQPSNTDDGRFIHLREILLVTYTEKAAGELKKRIQDGIVRRIKNTEDKKLAAHLENCLNNMHEALIGTIHSVCLRLLQTWPFETGVHFNTNIITSDEDEIEALLRESMRTDWQDETSFLPQALRAIESLGICLENKHFGVIRQTARELVSGSGAEIDTSADGGASLESLVDKAANTNAGLDKKEAQKLRLQLLHAFARRAAAALAARYDVYRRESGLISYDGMLRLTHNAVRGDDSVMLKTLRRRLRYGIIDEFQDTSPLQWDIFNGIFDVSPRASADISAQTAPRSKNVMYIVGDPKQSIYSFMNADVLSYIAAKKAILKNGGAVYSLEENYRSLPEMINGYNAILNCGREDDWFLFKGSDLITYRQDRRARPPKREGTPKYPLPHKAVQIVRMDDGTSADDSRVMMAAAACAAIKKLRGTTISIPGGLDYEDVKLDYEHFAVITETNDMAKFFIEAFRAPENRIPYAKYKQPGIFKSDMARDLRTVLNAVVRRHSRERAAAMLLTHFFNRPPETIDPVKDLTRCENHYCDGDGLCVPHALDSWGKLADRQLWARLFENIIDRTKIRQRLIRLFDGERKLADLRQIADYCVEYLYQKNSNLERLSDHLERLYNEEDEAGRDKNIHLLSTEKSCVTILTMHASKGLEFPIVFVMNSGVVNLPKSHILQWVDDAGKRRFTPYLSVGEDKKTLAAQIDACRLDRKRERRRLLYVAMTRPQAMLFLPAQKKDKELTPYLEELLKRGEESVELFDFEKFRGGRGDNDGAATTSSGGGDGLSIRLDDIPKLPLRKFICRETSYTGISGTLKKRGGGDALPFNEFHIGDIDTDDAGDDRLPGGRRTGIALHSIIETILEAEDINAILDDTDRLDGISERYLSQNGVLDHPLITDSKAVTRIASAMIKNALTAPYSVYADGPGGAANGIITVSALPRRDRVSEAEFMFCAAPHRIGGSMDLLFRVRNDAHPAHPYRYHFIDWKSDTLKSYDNESIRRHCDDNNYDLQSKIYAAALDKYLRGILGGRYDPKENLGDSIYVFLRGSGAYFAENLNKLKFDDAEIDILLNKCFW